MTDSTLSPFTAADGDNLAVQDWPLSESAPALRGVVVIVHGLGEHAGRYGRLAQHLNAWNFAVRGFDQYGHGESGGVRGALTSDTRLLDDLADVVDSTRNRMDYGAPLILLGHSMGGLVAARFVQARMRQVDGLVLSSPAFDPGLGTLQKLLLKSLGRIAPNFCIGNGLDPNYLSHDRSVVQAYAADPLVHDRISVRLARFIAQGGAQVVAGAAQWKVPTLLLYAGDDRLVDPAGSQAFADAAPKRYVTSQRFDQLYHEIFNEKDAQPVFDALKKWLDWNYPED